MATRRNTVESTSVLASLGGTVSNTDTVYFQQFATKYLSAGDLSAADLTAVYFTEGCRCNFSTDAGGGLKLVVNQTSTGVVVNRSACPQIDIISTSASGVVYKVTHNGSGVMTLGTMAVNTVAALSGALTIGASVNATTVIVDGPDAAVTFIEDNSYPATTVEVNQGRLLMARDFTTLTMRGTADVTLQSSTITGTTLTMNGGRLSVRNASTVGTFNGYAGVVDCTQAETLPTFTTSVHHPGLVIRLRKGQSEPTWGSLTEPYGSATRVYI